MTDRFRGMKKQRPIGGDRARQPHPPRAPGCAISNALRVGIQLADPGRAEREAALGLRRRVCRRGRHDPQPGQAAVARLRGGGQIVVVLAAEARIEPWPTADDRQRYSGAVHGGRERNGIDHLRGRRLVELAEPAIAPAMIDAIGDPFRWERVGVRVDDKRRGIRHRFTAELPGPRRRGREARRAEWR